MGNRVGLARTQALVEGLKRSQIKKTKTNALTNTFNL